MADSRAMRPQTDPNNFDRPARGRDYFVQRDLLPLPAPPTCKAWSGGAVARRLRQRISRRCVESHELNEVVEAVNFLNGEGMCTKPHSAGQKVALDHLNAIIEGDVRPPAGFSAQAAVRELLGSSSGFSDS